MKRGERREDRQKCLKFLFKFNGELGRFSAHLENFEGILIGVTNFDHYFFPSKYSL